MNADLNGRIVVFAGPSLPPKARPADPAFAWLPPAMAGDACALGGATPRAVVLIDGLFDTVPAIRHKELLTLMARGIPLIGAASMGALRAAELHRFGMIGAGRIFDAFASGRLIGDDEVAVMHGPADLDWAPFTEALVNVRATVLSAVRTGAIDGEIGRSVLTTAASTFYKERTWPGILRALADAGRLSPARSRALGDWLATGAVNLKQMDALACLEQALRVDPARRRRLAPPPATVFAAYLADQVASGVRPRPTIVAPR